MKYDKDSVIISDSLNGLGTDIYKEYLSHALCLGGACKFEFNGNPFELHEGDCMIVRKGKLVEKITPSADFKVKVIYVTPQFIELCTPQNNYGMKGQLSLFLNPVMRLDREQQDICKKDFENIEYRFNNENHNFYRDIMINVIQTMILDFFDFLTNSVMMPIAAIATCLLVSRVVGVDAIEQEVTLEGGTFRRKKIFCVMIRYICPIFAVIILLSSVANAFGLISM